MIEYLTTAFPLEPGTIIATGTPAGVGAGFDPPRFLADGDTVRIAIEGIGELSNPVVQGGTPNPPGSTEGGPSSSALPDGDRRWMQPAGAWAGPAHGRMVG